MLLLAVKYGFRIICYDDVVWVQKFGLEESRIQNCLYLFKLRNCFNFWVEFETMPRLKSLVFISKPCCEIYEPPS